MGTVLFVLLMVVVVIILMVVDRVLDVTMKMMLHTEGTSNTGGEDTIDGEKE